MANALQIDTLKFSRKLIEAGLEPKAAEAIAEGLAEADTSQVATKQDIAELKSDLFRHLWVLGVGIVGVSMAFNGLIVPFIIRAILGQ